jgi:hypothetical protein
MVVYDLNCPDGHAFEGWFRSPEAFRDQTDQGLLTCPVCQSPEVQRRPSASRLRRTEASALVSGSIPPVEVPSPVALRQALRRFVDRHFENVGREFAGEARRMHYGEVEERNIRGQATVTEVRQLRDEGIDATPLPLLAADEGKPN